MKHGPFPVVDDLIHQAERAAASKPDQVQLVAEVIRLTGDGGVDPYLLIGILIEGVVHTLANHIPAERQTEVAAATVRLLLNRLNASRLD
jgi:hypothetical protein